MVDGPGAQHHFFAAINSRWSQPPATKYQTPNIVSRTSFASSQP
jgi:hypothetical protein